MSTTSTANLQLIKNNADEPIKNWRTNDNTNMESLDVAIKAVQDATDTLEKARQNLNNLIGVIGKNSSNADLITKTQARANLDVPQSNGAVRSLQEDEQMIATNASLIASLQDSVSYTVATGVTVTRRGHVALLSVWNVTVANDGQLHSVGTLPADWRPVSATSNSSANSLWGIELDRYGVINVLNKSTTSTTVWTTLTYLVA